MPRVMALMMLLLACGRAEPVRPGPRPPVFPCELSVEPRDLDFGELAPGGRASRSLLLRNRGDGLCSLSFPSLTVTSIGFFPLDSAELAGTGDGQLWAFVPPNGGAAVLARLDPSNANVLERYSLPTINSVGGWAIKFFGGSFFIFIGSDIWKVERRGLDRTRPEPTIPPVRVLVTPGRDIVGAGVSTCAPTQ